MSTYQAHRNLVAAIIKSALLDLRSNDGRAAYEAKVFFQSDYAECLADYLGLDINEIRKVLEIEYTAR